MVLPVDQIGDAVVLIHKDLLEQRLMDDLLVVRPFGDESDDVVGHRHGGQCRLKADVGRFPVLSADEQDLGDVGLSLLIPAQKLLPAEQALVRAGKARVDHVVSARRLQLGIAVILIIAVIEILARALQNPVRRQVDEEGRQRVLRQSVQLRLHLLIAGRQELVRAPDVRDDGKHHRQQQEHEHAAAEQDARDHQIRDAGQADDHVADQEKDQQQERHDQQADLPVALLELSAVPHEHAVA